MKTRVSLVVSVLLGLALTNTAQAETWLTSPIKYVYTMANGDFVLIFSTDAAGCTYAPATTA